MTTGDRWKYSWIEWDDKELAKELAPWVNQNEEVSITELNYQPTKLKVEDHLKSKKRS